MNNSKTKQKNDIRGQCFVQTSLRYDLEKAIAGQQVCSKIILTLILLLIFLSTAILVGILGASIGLDLSLKTESQLESSLMILVVLTWLVTAVFQNFNKSLLIVIIGLSISVVIQGLLTGWGLLESPSFLLARTALTILAVWVISCIIFCLMRFAIASIDVLFKKSRYVKGTALFIAFFGALVGALVAIAAEDQNPSSQVKVVAVLSGIGFEVTLALGGWWANRRRSVPWIHPDLFRSWALIIASWRSTSFYNLDLSTVNFRGAKLANIDLRARKLYRTCFQDVTGLERARVDSLYLDLENPKVQKLLTHGSSQDRDFTRLNLRGAYLQNTGLRQFNFTDADLTGADMQGADLRGSILVRAQVIGVDFTNADLTGICIEDWSVNSQTCFTNVRCDYVYRRLNDRLEPIERFPADRNFEPREFESLYQEVENVVELIFKEGVNWRAFSFTLQKLQLEDEGLGLELKGIEKRGDLWVVKVTHNETADKQVVEQHFFVMYEQMKQQLAAKDQQIFQLLGIATDQAESVKNFSRQPFGASFFIAGSTITNLVGSGEIDYNEASSKIRSFVASGGDPTQVTIAVNTLLEQLQNLNVATTLEKQAALIEQVILTEAQKDPIFKQFFIQQGKQLADEIPNSAIASAIRNAIAQLS